MGGAILPIRKANKVAPPAIKRPFNISGARAIRPAPRAKPPTTLNNPPRKPPPVFGPCFSSPGVPCGPTSPLGPCCPKLRALSDICFFCLISCSSNNLSSL